MFGAPILLTLLSFGYYHDPKPLVPPECPSLPDKLEAALERATEQECEECPDTTKVSIEEACTAESYVLPIGVAGGGGVLAGAALVAGLYGGGKRRRRRGEITRIERAAPARLPPRR